MNEKIGFYKAKRDFETKSFAIFAGEIFYLDNVIDNECTIFQEDEILSLDDFEYLEEKEVSVSTYKKLLLDASSFKKFNYIPKGKFKYTLNDLEQYIDHFEYALNVDLLHEILSHLIRPFDAISNKRVVDLWLKGETSIIYAVTKYLGRFVCELEGQDKEQYLKDMMYKIKLHLLDIEDSSLYVDPFLVYIAKMMETTDVKNLVNEENPETINLYMDLMDIGISHGIKECIANVAYEYYCGSPFSSRDTYKAEPLFIRLAEEFDDPYALNTLGYIYYYHRNENPNRYYIAFSYYSLASQMGVVEATYKCADILDKGLIGVTNKRYAFDLINKVYGSSGADMLEGNYYSKFADLSLRLGVHYLNGDGVDKDPFRGYAHLLNAKRAIEYRMKNSKYIGDETVLKHINDELEKCEFPYARINEDDFEPFDIDMTSIETLMIYSAGDFDSNIKTTIKVIDKNTFIVEIRPTTYKFLIFPVLEHHQSYFVDKVHIKVTCEDAQKIKDYFALNTAVIFDNDYNGHNSIIIFNNNHTRSIFPIRDVYVLLKDSKIYK